MFKWSICSSYGWNNSTINLLLVIQKQCMKTLALRARVFIHYFLVFGYPGETLALVVHILLKSYVIKSL